MKTVRASGSLIQDRYRIVKMLGQGGSGTTYQAQDCLTGYYVALKELSLKGLKDWKQLELFEREAQVLAGLDHPAIPNYVDYFQVDFDNDRCFYIVQALAAGHSLANLVAEGVHFSEADARYIASEILQILDYLHSLNPPIIHRDIKPQNIICRNDGHLFLVDFGAVQTIYQHTVAFRSTIVGTYGYMAPEQFRGQAHINTDLYGLGATLLHLLTHRDPADLPQTRLTYNFRPWVNISDAFADWLEHMLEPLAEDRFVSAHAAQIALNDSARSRPAITAPQQHHSQSKPVKSKVQLVRTSTHLSVKIPALGFRGKELKFAFWAIAAGSVIFSSYLLFSVAILRTPGSVSVTILFGSVIIGILWLLINTFFGMVTIEINPEYFTITRHLFDWQYNTKVGQT